ncbi:MAG: peptide ABC transporter ATP-binding protein [Proteobacteria bacterium]|nr:MAG: peptide ABC transporter ATP-binding protein [Pseudomonadota bacterium]
MRDAAILQISDLTVSFETENGRVRALDDVCLRLESGKILGLVGESGCGKSVTALSIMRLLPKPAGVIESGRILFKGTDIAVLSAEDVHAIRGSGISMIFQEPMTALNPVKRIGSQLAEVYELKQPDMNAADMRVAAVKMLARVGIPEPDLRCEEYPHQLSGGMRQRVMIAMALAGRPDILIADEPTTALDVTIQAQILDLILALQEQTGMAVIFITHDLGVIAEICHDVAVMYAGQVVESASVQDLFVRPCHPYTQGLLRSIPKLDRPNKTLLPTIEGSVPALDAMPAGCRFATRCPRVMAACRTRTPELMPVDDGHQTRCYLYKGS